MSADLIKGDYYLVSMKRAGKSLRIARFNGFHTGEGHFDKDWQGDSGSEWDTWMDEDIEGYLPLNKIAISINDIKEITHIFFR